MKHKMSVTIVLMITCIVLLILCILTVVFDGGNITSDTKPVTGEEIYISSDIARPQLRPQLGGERKLDYNSDDYAKTVMYAQLYMDEDYLRIHFPELFEDTAGAHSHEEYADAPHENEFNESLLETYLADNGLAAGTVNVVTYNMYATANTGRPEILFYNPYSERTTPLYYVNLQDERTNENYDIWCLRGITTEEFCNMLCELVEHGYVPYATEDGLMCNYQSANEVADVIAHSENNSVVFGFLATDENDVMSTITFTYYKDCILYDWSNGVIETLQNKECCFAVSIIYPLDYVLGY